MDFIADKGNLNKVLEKFKILFITLTLEIFINLSMLIEAFSQKVLIQKQCKIVFKKSVNTFRTSFLNLGCQFYKNY